MADFGVAGQSARRRFARTILALAVGVTLAGGAGGAAAAPEPDLIAFARAFNAAWNAHDADAVTAFFAPGATIRQTDVRLAVTAVDGAEPPVAEDAYGAGPRSLAYAQDGGDRPRGDVLWAAGAPRIRAWLLPLFAAGHRVEAFAYRAAGDTVIWRYRAFADPYQGLAGVEPAEGTADLVVRAERIVSFTFTTEGETVTRRTRQFGAAVGVRIAAVTAPPRPATSRAPGLAVPAERHSSRGAPDPRLPLSLVAAALAGLAVRQHRRTRSPCRPTTFGSGDGAIDWPAVDEDRKGRRRPAEGDGA